MSQHLRRLQNELRMAGFDPGVADGQIGPRTRGALDRAAMDGRLAVVPAPAGAKPVPAPAVAPVAQAAGIPAYAEIERVYGPAGGPLATAGRV